MRWIVRGDFDGFFGLALDNLVQLLLIDTLCRGVLGFPPALVYGTILPAAAVSVIVIVKASVDLIVSVLGLHWVEDLPGLMAQARRALKPDGLFLAALFGGSTLTELRQALTAAELEITGGASARVSPFADGFDGAALLQRAEEIAKAAGHKTISLITENTHLDAQRLYRSKGYQEIAPRPLVKGDWQVDASEWILFVKTI